MDSYGTLFSCACWAALVCSFAGSAASNREALELTMAREEVCVVGMGHQLSVLEAQVRAYLEAYRDVIEPALAVMVTE